MALDRKCDKCGASSSSEVRVDIMLMDAVTQGQPTAVSFVTDACPKCRDAECARLFQVGMAQLNRDIPRHKELISNSDEASGLEKQMREAVGKRDLYKDDHIIPIPATRESPASERWDNAKSEAEHRKLQVVVDEIQQAIREKEVRRAYVLDDKNYQQ